MNGQSEKINKVEIWVSTQSGEKKLFKEKDILFKESPSIKGENLIRVDTIKTFQTIDGMGSSFETATCYNDGTADSNIAQVDISVTPVAPTPTVVDSEGYINGTPLTTHTTTAFNSVGTSTLVVFVSSHPFWPWPNGSPVSIGGVTDNVGNTWNVLVGPTTWPGSSYTLMSAIYYVNAPVTSETHTVTVTLTNPGPLVMHVFAVSGSNIIGPPIYSPITGPSEYSVSADVISEAIEVPAETLLLSWVKNENPP